MRETSVAKIVEIGCSPYRRCIVTRVHLYLCGLACLRRAGTKLLSGVGSRSPLIAAGWTDTSIWEAMPGITAEKNKARFSKMAEKLPMQGVSRADEMANGLLFLMKNEDRRISAATTQWTFGRNNRGTLNR